MAALLLLSGIGLCIYSLSLRGSAVNAGARTAVTIVGIAIPVLMAWGAYMIYRSVFPPRARHLRLEVESPDVARGGEVVARLEHARPDKASDKLELGLVCTEFYDERKPDGHGGSNRVTSQVVAFEEWHPYPGGPAQTVRFEVPPDAPFSYRGHCLSYVWRVSARLPRRLRFDPAVNVELTVRP